MNTQSSNGCECPTEKGLQWHTYECTFADKPSPEDWEADYYEGGMGAIVSRKRNELASYKEIKELIERVRTADRERVRGLVEDMLDETYIFSGSHIEPEERAVRNAQKFGHNHAVKEVLALLSTEEITK